MGDRRGAKNEKNDMMRDTKQPHTSLPGGGRKSYQKPHRHIKIEPEQEENDDEIHNSSPEPQPSETGLAQAVPITTPRWGATLLQRESSLVPRASGEETPRVPPVDDDDAEDIMPLEELMLVQRAAEKRGHGGRPIKREEHWPPLANFHPRVRTAAEQSMAISAPHWCKRGSTGGSAKYVQILNEKVRYARVCCCFKEESVQCEAGLKFLRPTQRQFPALDQAGIPRYALQPHCGNHGAWVVVPNEAVECEGPAALHRLHRSLQPSIEGPEKRPRVRAPPEVIPLVHSEHRKHLTASARNVLSSVAKILKETHPALTDWSTDPLLGKDKVCAEGLRKIRSGRF